MANDNLGTSSAPPGYETALPARKLMPVLQMEDGHRIAASELLLIDPSNLSMEFAIQASWQAAISWGTSKVILKAERAKRELEAVEGRLFLEYRDRLPGSGSRPPSVESVKASVATDSRMAAAYEALFQAEAERDAWKSVSLALSAKREMLISLGAEMRIDRKAAT